MRKERAVLAGGCFWGMQDLIRRYDGVAIPSLLTDNRESDAPSGLIGDEPIK